MARTPPKKPAKRPGRRQRPHGVLPAGFVWREGRPRWIPSPSRREQGWRPVDLARVERGAKVWLAQGAAIERCHAINAAVAAWTLRGVAPPADMAAFAPKGSVDASRPSPSEQKSRRSIGALADAWLASDKFTLRRGQGGLADSTKIDYRSKLNRLFVALVEDEANPDKIARLRDLDIDTLAAPEDEGDDFPLDQAYSWLMKNVGHAQAHGVLSVASAWFTWCWRKKRIKALATNPVELIDRTTPEGHIRIASPDEVRALIAAADVVGHPSIGDAVLLALDLGWSLTDLLRLDWRRVITQPNPETGEPHMVVKRVARQKTGVASSDIPLMALGLAAVARIRARFADAKVSPTHLIVREPSPRNRTGVWTTKAFNDAWNVVKTRAAQEAPTLLGIEGKGDDSVSPFDFMDLRDTFITLAREVPLSVEETTQRSLHKSNARVHAVWQKHYGAATPLMGAAGARKMDAHLAATGWRAVLPGGV
jgi:integrase